jgi:hypothetical protein
MSKILDPARDAPETAAPVRVEFAAGPKEEETMTPTTPVRPPLDSCRSTALFFILLLALALALPIPASAGLVFKQEIRGEGEAAKFQNMTMHSWLDTGGAKMEILSSGSPMLKAGNYLLIRPDDDAMLLVNPKEKTYTSMDIGQIMGSMGQMMGGEGGVSMSFSDPIVEKLLEEDGGTLLGRSTRHYRWRTRYTMSMTMPMGMGMDIATDETQDVWVADLQLDPRIMRSFANMGGGASTPEDFRKLVEAAKKVQNGFPLKMVTVSSSKTTAKGSGPMAAMMARSMGQNDDKPQTMTMVVTELSEEKVPAATFSIPPGYTETEMMAPAMKMPDMSSPPR